MIKVCHVISGYHRTDARVFQRQCKSLKNAGFEVSLLTNDGQPEQIIDGIKVFHTKKFWPSRLKVLLFAKFQFLRAALEIDADIYQMHSPELISLGLALQKVGKKVVYDAHEDLPRHIMEKEWLPVVFRKPVSWITEKFMNKQLAKYDAIVSPHTHVVQYLSLINKDVRLIANFPIVASEFNFSEEGYLGREKIMCYTGTVYSYSNQETILDAMQKVKEIRYEIAGYIDPSHLEALSKHKVFDRVKFHGRIPWSKMQEFYHKNRLGVVVYDYKLNLGYKLGSYGTNKIFEYMETGLPFICTDYILWKEIVDENNCGICVEPGNTEQIANAIQYLIDQPELAYQMGQNGRKAVLNKYNWRSQEIDYVDLFNKFSIAK